MAAHRVAAWRVRLYLAEVVNHRQLKVRVEADQRLPRCARRHDLPAAARDIRNKRSRGDRVACRQTERKYNANYAFVTAVACCML
jgi:hypothetical protein